MLLWMAEDFLLHPKRENLEEVGVEYFNDLASRSFFQRSSSRSKCYVMHDLLNDLALSLENFVLKWRLTIHMTCQERLVIFHILE